MKRIFCVLLFVGCLLTLGACSADGEGASGFFETFFNDYIAKYFEDYVATCNGFGQPLLEVPYVGEALAVLMTAFAYAIGGVLLVFRILIAFVFFFLIQTASFVELIIKGFSEILLGLISA